MSILTHPLTASCAETYHRLPSHVDGDTGPVTRRRLDRHLARCPKCREMLERLVRGIEVLRTSGSDDIGEPRGSVADAVLERIRDDDTPEGERR